MEDDIELSTRHCELIPKMMNLFIKDLDSSNGVFINSSRIPPQTEVQIHPGDEVLFGKTRYIFFDNKEDYEKAFPKPDRRKHPRPKHLFCPKHLINFHFATRTWLCLYALAIVLTIFSAANNSVLTIPLPENLKFLSSLYHEQIILSGIKMTVWVWILCLIHSFLQINYFNRNILRKVASTALFGLALFLTVDFQHGPLWHIRAYVEGRANVVNENFGDKSITRLRAAIDHQAKLTRAYSKTASFLDKEALKMLQEDYKAINQKLNSEISRLTMR